MLRRLNNVFKAEKNFMKKSKKIFSGQIGLQFFRLNDQHLIIQFLD